MDDRRTFAVCGSFIVASVVSGKQAYLVVREVSRCLGACTFNYFGSIRCVLPESLTLGLARRNLFEEPTAGNLHGGVCEGGESLSIHGEPNSGTKPETAETAKGSLKVMV